QPREAVLGKRVPPAAELGPGTPFDRHECHNQPLGCDLLLLGFGDVVSPIGLLGNPDTETYSSVLKRAQDAAQKVGLSIVPIEARNWQEIENAFAVLAKERISAIMVASDAIFFGQRQRIAELALNNRLPTMFSLREYAQAGGLMSYGENIADFFRRAASFVDKILKGAKPGDL